MFADFRKKFAHDTSNKPEIQRFKEYLKSEIEYILNAKLKDIKAED
jgi:hypothetical protein